jgi:hypothetical protein
MTTPPDPLPLRPSRFTPWHELARFAHEGDEGGHWVTIDGEHVWIRGPRPEKAPHEMTRDEFYHKISSAPTNALATTVTEDWSNLRVQGKRAGYMVMGGMRDSSLQGERHYMDPVGKIPPGPDHDEAASLTGRELLAYLKARGAGLSHEQGMVYALEVAGELPAGEAYRRIVQEANRGKP